MCICAGSPIPNLMNTGCIIVKLQTIRRWESIVSIVYEVLVRVGTATASHVAAKTACLLARNRANSTILFITLKIKHLPELETAFMQSMAKSKGVPVISCCSCPGSVRLYLTRPDPAQLVETHLDPSSRPQRHLQSRQPSPRSSKQLS